MKSERVNGDFPVGPKRLVQSTIARKKAFSKLEAVSTLGSCGLCTDHPGNVELISVKIFVTEMSQLSSTQGPARNSREDLPLFSVPCHIPISPPSPVPSRAPTPSQGTHSSGSTEINMPSHTFRDVLSRARGLELSFLVASSHGHCLTPACTDVVCLGAAA